MRTTHHLIAGMFLILFTSICFGQTGPSGPQAVAKQDPNRIVATAGGKQITAQQAWGMINTVAPPARSQWIGKLPKLVEQLYLQRRIADEAKLQHLDKQSPWKEQIIKGGMMAHNYTNNANDPNSPPAVQDQINNAIQKILWNAYLGQAQTKEERATLLKNEREKYVLHVQDADFFKDGK